MNPDRQIDNVQYGDNNAVSYPFKDNFSLYLVKKVEKLVMATYLITEHLSYKEPIRQSIRTTSTQLIKDIVNSIEDKEDSSSNNIQSSLLQLESLLDLGSKTCLLTQANVSIVKDEAARISKEVNSHNEAVDGNALIKKSFFVVNVPKDNPVKDIKDINTIKRTNTETVPNRSVRKPNVYGTVAGNNRLEKKDSINSGFKKNTAPNKTTNKKSRSAEITEIVRKKGKVTIKDISMVITDCSEKTIQRELQKLVSSGVMSKEGERRWSTYSII